jgi:hypothetical protein
VGIPTSWNPNTPEGHENFASEISKIWCLF